MGLDVTLAIIVLLAGLRGWLKGFLRQAIALGALVGCVYLADPVRDFVRPHLAPYFPSIRPELFDRLLWWTAAVTTYVVTAGIPLTLVRWARRRPYGYVEPNRGDQGAGFLLGALKGALVAVFLTAGLMKYQPTIAKFAGGTWVEEMTGSSYALQWSGQYQPAQRIWYSPPVQSFIAHVRERGLWATPKGSEPPALQASSGSAQGRTLEIPARRLDPDSPAFLRELDEELRREGLRSPR